MDSSIANSSRDTLSLITSPELSTIAKSEHVRAQFRKKIICKEKLSQSAV